MDCKSSKTIIKRQEKHTINLYIGIGFLGLSLIWLIICNLSAWHTIDPKDVRFNDTVTYEWTSQYLLGKRNITPDFALRPPVYPLFLSFFDPPIEMDNARRVIFWQTIIYSIACVILCLGIFLLTGNAWMGVMFCMVLCLHSSGIYRVNCLLADGFSLSLFLLFCGSLALALRKNSLWKDYLIPMWWGLVGFFLALISLTRYQYAYVCVFILPIVVFYFIKEKKKRVILNLSVLIACFITPVILWKAYCLSDGMESRQERYFWFVMGKMIAPNFYVGPENDHAENAIALMWNENFRRGRVGSRGAYPEWNYVRQNYSRYQRQRIKNMNTPIWQGDRIRNDVYDFNKFNNTIRTLVFRSLRYNGTAILKHRLGDLWRWITLVHDKKYQLAFKKLTFGRLIKDARDMKMSFPANLMNTIRVNMINIQGHNIYYHLGINVLLFLLLLPFFMFSSGRRYWPFVFIVAAFVYSDLLTIGLLYSGPQPRFKIITYPALWFLNVMMGYYVIRYFLNHISLRKRQG